VGYLKVDFAGAEQIAAALKQNAEERTSDINSLSQRVNPSAVWEGDAATAYQEKYEQWRAAETNLVNALDELGGVVKQIIDNFNQIDEQGAGALR
jgi:WXG100 family type VII secretion target